MRAVAAGLVAVLGCGTGGGVQVVDRIEGDWAVLVDEQGEQGRVPREAFPDVGEGDVLVDYVPDPHERARRMRDIAARRARLLRDDGADLVLDRSAP